MTESTLLAAVRAAADPIDAAPAVAAGVPQAEHERAVAAARDEALANGRAEGTAQGAAAERARIAAILDHDAARGRETLARHFAFSTDMSPDAAAAALAAAPVSAAAPALFAEMAATKQPAIGADGGEPKEMSDYEKGAAEARRLIGK